MRNRLFRLRKTESGFSLIELLIVMAMIVILAAISVPYLVNYKKLYRSEDQALKLIDLMREAAQVALTQRRTIRFEIDLTDNAVLLIDENGASPDKMLKKVPLDLPKDIRIDIIPAGVTKPVPPNYSNIVFAADTVGHLRGTVSVNGHQVWNARFKSDGSVVTHANVPVNANIYIWPPVSPGSSTPRSKTEIRLITLFGGSGAVRYWKHSGIAFVPIS